MVEVLLYAYCQGVRSSRKIARALERDVGFRVVVLDGSKVAANAALDNNRSYEVIEAEVRQMLANTTDPDSRIMKTRQGYVQGYNVQAVVSQDQIIVAVGVTQEANDVQQLKPMLQTPERTLKAAGIEEHPRIGLADAGYWSEANNTVCSQPEGTSGPLPLPKIGSSARH